MKVYLWFHNIRTIVDKHPRVERIHHTIFTGESLSEKDFDYLTKRAKLIDTNEGGWRIWELEL